MATKDVSGAGSASLDSANGHRSRRNVLAMFGAGSAAAIATLFSKDQARAGHDATNVLHLGESNTAPTGQETEVNADVEGYGLRVNNDGASGEEADSGAIQGHSDAGVAGRFTTSTGESLHCDGRAAIFGSVEDNLLLIGNDNASAGNGMSVYGYSSYAVEGEYRGPGSEEAIAAGVVGVSTGEDENYGAGPGTGVFGSSGTGVAVAGFSAGTAVGVQGESTDGIGVLAMSENELALSVQGRAGFATAGSGSVAAGQSSAFVNAAVTANSHVTVTLTSDGAGRSVSWVNRDPGNGFTVHLTKKGPAVSFTYLVVEPG